MSKAQKALIEKTKEVASTQYAGTGLKVNVRGLDPGDTKTVGQDIGWALRTEASVVHEPRVYGKESPYSYFGDLFHAQAGPHHPGFRGANVRMARYAGELVSEVERGSVEGRRVERILREESRAGDPVEVDRRTREGIKELRALSTGAGATASGSNGAVFVSPFFLTSEFAPYRGVERSFVDQCHKVPLPAYGMQVYIPNFSAATTASQQTEGSALAEGSPASAFEGSEVKTIGGKQVISQQLYERGYSGGGTFDVLLQAQMSEQLGQEVDLFVLNQAITNGTAVSGNATYKAETFYEDVAKAREILTDTAGTRLRPTHLFTTSDFYSWVTWHGSESGAKLLVEPRFIPGFPLAKGADDFDSGEVQQWSRFTGTVLPGGVLWFTDDNIPSVGTTTKTQLLVSTPEVAIVVMEGEPRFRVYTETLANELKVVVVLDEYVAAITRHAAGTAVITGAGYVTTQK